VWLPQVGVIVTVPPAESRRAMPSPLTRTRRASL
jgi:hypothetical protein